MATISYKGPRAYNAPLKAPIKDGYIQPAFASDAEREKKKKQLEEWIKTQNAIREGARVRAEAKKRYDEYIQKRKETARLNEKKRQEEIRQRQEEEDELLRKENERVENLRKAEMSEEEYQKFLDRKIKQHGALRIPAKWAKADYYFYDWPMRGFFHLQGHINNALKGGTDANMETSIGNISLADANISGAEAHLKMLELQSSIDKAAGQIDMYKEIYAPKAGETPEQRAQAQRQLQSKINEINAGIAQLKQQMQDPQLQALDQAYKIDKYTDNMGVWDTVKFGAGVLWDSVKGVSVLDDKAANLRRDIAKRRTQEYLEDYDRQLNERYNQKDTLYSPEDKYIDPKTQAYIPAYIAQDRENRQAGVENFINDQRARGNLTKSEMHILDRERFMDFDKTDTEHYLGEQKIKKEQAQQDYVDTAKFQARMNQIFEPSKAIQEGLSVNQNASIFDWNYWKYVMPNMIGSSNSSTSQLKANAAQALGTVAGIALAPVTGGGSLALTNLSTIASAPWQIEGALDENRGEVGSRRVDSLVQAMRELNDDNGNNDIVNDLKRQSIAYWKSQGMSDDWINSRFNSGSDEDIANVMRDFIAGYTRNNSPKLKAAFFESQKGLKAQYWADNLRTAGEFPVQFMMQLVPTGSARKYMSIGIDRKMQAVASKVKSGAITEEVAQRWMRRYGAKEAESKASKFAHGFSSVKSQMSSGFETGATIMDSLGFGYGGHVIGGTIGAVTKPVFKLGASMLPETFRADIADLGRTFMHKYRWIYDKLLPKQWMRLAAKYGLNAINRGVISGLSEGAEEGVQYLNSQEDFASKFGFSVPNIADLLANDWAQGRRVASAYMALLGLSKSELSDDEEFWQNVRGGFALGFAHPAIMNIAGSVPNAIRQYNADQVLTESLVMGRELDKLDRAANVTFAKWAMKGKGGALLSELSRLYGEDKQRDGDQRKHSDEDYDEKLNAIRTINRLVDNKRVRGMLEAKGFKYGTSEYAHAVADIYNTQSSLLENSKETITQDHALQQLYNSAEFQEEVGKIVTSAVDTDFGVQMMLKGAQRQAADAVEARLVKEAKESGEQIGSKKFKKKLYDARKAAEEEAKMQFMDENKQKVLYQTRLANRLKALLTIKQQEHSLNQIYTKLAKLNIKSKKQDSKLVSNEIDKQIKEVKDILLGIDDTLDFGKTEQDALKAIDSIPTITEYNTDESQQLELNLAMLRADRAVTEQTLNTFQYGIVKDKDGKYQYNEKQYLKEADRDRRLNAAKNAGDDELVKQIESEDTTMEYNPDDVAGNAYRHRISTIMQAEKRNDKLDTLVADMYAGDATAKYMESVAEEQERAAKEVSKSPIKYKKPEEDPLANRESKPTTTTASATTTPSTESKLEQTKEKRKKAFTKSEEKFQRNKQRAKDAYERRKNRYKNWKKGSLNAAIIPFQDAMVSIANSLMKNAEIGAYKIQQFIEDVKEIAGDIDIKDYIPQLKQLYIKNAVKIAYQQPDFASNISSATEVVAYGLVAKPPYIRPEIQITNPVQYALNQDEAKIDKATASYFDVIVETENGPVLCTNKEAADKIADRSKPFLNQLIAELNNVKGSDEAFLSKLESVFRNTPVQYKEYLKYKNVPGIIEAIARNAIAVHPTDSIIAGIKVRNAVIATLLGKESELEPSVYGPDFNELVQDCIGLRNTLTMAGYTVITTAQNVYDLDTKTCEEADIILTNEKGEIRIIDVLSSYTDILSRWERRPGMEAHYLIREREEDMLHNLQDIISKKTNRKIVSLGVLPILANGRSISIQKQNGEIKFLPVVLKNSLTKDEYAELSKDEQEQLMRVKQRAITEIVDKYNETALAYNDILKQVKKLGQSLYDNQNEIQTIQYPTPVSLHDCDEIADRLSQQLQGIQEKQNELNVHYTEVKAQQEAQFRSEEEEEYFKQYVEAISESQPTATELVGFLEDSCSELDLLLDEFTPGKPISKEDKVLINKIYKAIFDAQCALDDVLQTKSLEGVDVTAEEELIASAVEKLVQNREYFGAASMFMQKWWLTNFIGKEDNFISYYDQLTSWEKTLRDHLLDGLYGHEKLQAWYNSLMNNYLPVLLDNAQSFLDKRIGNDPVQKARLQNAIKSVRDLAEDFNILYGDREDEQFPGPPKSELERINRMPHAFKDYYSISRTHPLSWNAMSMNDNYYWMSKQPDFLEKATFNLYVATKEMHYTNRRTNASYTIKPGELAVYVAYTDKDGKQHWADIPLMIDESYYPNATEAERRRIHEVNQGQRKFTKRYLEMVEYVKTHPGAKINVTFNTNKGSIEYDKKGNYHSPMEFVFKGYGNEINLYTVAATPASRIGISDFRCNRDGTISYDVYTGPRMNQIIPGFDDEFKKQTLRINSGAIIYKYYTGNKKSIGIPIVGATIGQVNKSMASKLANILIALYDGKTTYKGYDTFQLAHQLLYVQDPNSTRVLTQYNKTTNMVEIVRQGNVNGIKIGNTLFDINDLRGSGREKLVDKLASMSVTINAKELNFNVAQSSNSLFEAVRSQFLNTSANEIELPNGLVMTRDDFTHQNGTSVGSTWLGCMLRKGLLVTKAVGQSYTQVNIASCELVNEKDVDAASNQAAAEQAAEQAVDQKQKEENRQRIFDILGDGNGLLTKQQKESVGDGWSQSTRDDVLNFFDEVLGDLAKHGSTLNLEDDTCLGQIGNEYIMGVCHALSIDLSTHAPKSAAYHEAFHKIFELLVPESTRDKLYERFRSRHKNATDRQIAEEFADLFTRYMANRRDSDKSKWYKRLFSWFKKIGITIGILRKVGLRGTTELYQVFHDTTNGKYRNATISEKQKARFDKLFEGGLHYTVTNTKTKKSANFIELSNSADVQDMVESLGFFAARVLKLDALNASDMRLQDAKSFVKALPEKFLDALCGRWLPEKDLTYTQRAYREVFKEHVTYEYAANYRQGDAPIGKKVSYPNLDILLPKVNEYLKNSITRYAGKIDERDDEDEDQKVQNSNIDKFDRAAYEFSKLDSLPDSVKFFFATVPYLTWQDTENGRTTAYDLSKNKFQSPTFMPLEEVYNVLINEFGKVTTAEELDNELAKKANAKPMYKFIYDKFHALYSQAYAVDENNNVKVDYDKEAYMLQIVGALHSMKHTFIYAQSERQADGGKQVTIKESSLDRDKRMFSTQWTNFLVSGQVSVFNRNRDQNGHLTFREGMGGPKGQDIFSRTAKSLSDIRQWITSAGDELALDGVTYHKTAYREIDVLKDQIISKLNKIGIIFTKEALDHMLSTSYGDIGYEGLAQMFTDKGVSQITTFIDLLNSFVNPDGSVNQQNVLKGYTNNGFVKELGNMQGAYNRITISNMAQGLGGKRYFSISQNNSITSIIDALNTNDQNNPLIQRLNRFGYNIQTVNGIPSGSIILRNKNNKLRAFTYLGLKTDNRNDNGTEYKLESQIDDYITKMAMLQQGILIFPTLADKGTWMCIDGVKIPGMEFGETLDQFGNKQYTVKNVPTIIWQKTKAGFIPHLRPSNAVLDQMIQYAEGEKLAICQCMDELGYSEIPGYEKVRKSALPKAAWIKNYHTKNKQGVEPNGTRFLSLTELRILRNDKDKDGNLIQKIDIVNLNNPNISSTELLKLANEKFFDKTLEEKREIMALTLESQLDEEVNKALSLGLIERKDWKRGDGSVGVSANDKSSKLNLTNTHLNSQQIQVVALQIMNSIDSFKNMPAGPEKNARFEACKSLAIAAILQDGTIRSTISSQEVLRCFVGHPAEFKVEYDMKHGRIKDSTADLQKRIGGLVSTGEDNVPSPYVSKTYRCAECSDYTVGSTADIAGRLRELFKSSSTRESAAIALENAIDQYFATDEKAFTRSTRTADKEQKKAAQIQLQILLDEKNDVKSRIWHDVYMLGDISKLKNHEIIQKLLGKYIPNSDAINSVIRAVEKAEDLSEQFASAYDEDINVADGASYITADMCETLLRMRGQLNGKVKAAFDLLSGKEATTWTSKVEAYNTVYEAVNIVTTKYTAYGFRDHTLNDERMSDVCVAYYNKFALFPLFPGIATGPMAGIYQKMLNEKVDMLLMDSAVKVGSQGAVKYKDGAINEPFNVYEQDFTFLRRQLNTDPEEGEFANLGTQMIKIVLQNLRLFRDNYVDSRTGKLVDGKTILSQYMNAINKLEKLGVKEFDDNFFTNGKLDQKKLSTYLLDQLTSRDADKGLLEALQLNNDGQISCPIAATQDSSWIESIFISAINKAIINIPTPGSSFVQRSVFAMENSATEGGSIQGANKYNGKKLQMINKDHSMDAVISIDYFDHILPKKPMSFEQKRQWLIDNGIIGEGAKANTVGYRIPTQAQSSIHALRFIDVIETVKSTIILPEEFTKITGSDFDIDHLYLASYNYQADENGNVHEVVGGESKEAYQNELLDCMMTLLKDTENSINSLFKSIDNDTTLAKSIADQIPVSSSTKHLAYNFGTLHEQAERRLDYITGKFGIGPFALNVTSHVLTCLFGVRFRDTDFTRTTGIFNFDKLVDYDGNAISSWISAFINAHVDIVKDPWVSRMGIDKFTYNMVNLLVRSGYGEAGMWFIAQPIIRDMAMASSNAESQFSRDVSKYSSVYAAQKDAVAQAVLQYLTKEEVSEDILNKYIESSPSNLTTRVNAVKYILDNQQVLKQIAINPGATTVTVGEIEYNVKDVQKNVFYAWKTLEKYSLALNMLVQYTKIDTKKEGKTFLEMQRYLDQYLKLTTDEKSLWDLESIQRLVQNTWIDSKTKDACNYPFRVLGSQMFNANRTFINDLVLPITRALQGPDSSLNVDLMNEVSLALQTRIKSMYIVDYAKRVLGKTDQDLTNLFVGNWCMNHRFSMLWDAIRNNPKYARLKDNQLLTHLYALPEEQSTYVDGKEVMKPAFLSISDSIEDSKLNTKLMKDAWEDLLRDPDVNVQNFAKDLIVYAFLTTGEYSGWNKLFKYVPEAWRTGQIGDIPKDMNSFADYIRKQLSDESFILTTVDEYLDEIVANHYQDYKFSRRVNIQNRDGSNNFIKFGKTIAIGARTKDASTLPTYITTVIPGRRGRNASDYIAYRLAYTITVNEDHQSYGYPVYVRCSRKGYTSSDKRNNIYEYGWHFNYAENERIEYASFDYNAGIKRVTDYLNSNRIELNDLKTKLPELSDAIAKVYVGMQAENINPIDSAVEQPSQQTGPVNVYYGSGDNIALSNFARRPFSTRIGTFDTVEGAFHACKLWYTNGPKYVIRDSNGRITAFTDEGKRVLNSLQNASGPEARKIGRSIQGLDVTKWDEVSGDMLEDLMRRSFEQNEDARDELVSTGDRQITHIGKSGKEEDNGRFSEILTKIRKEFASLRPPVSSKIFTTKFYTRQAVENDRKTLYVFTDNTDRDSGSGLVDDNSEYAKKYGKGKHYPTVTQAAIRGLDNAMPLSTQRWFHGEYKREKGRWTDKDFDEFKKVIDQEIQDIMDKWDTGNYERLAIGGTDGFFNSGISNITITRTPKLYQYLKQKVQELYKHVDANAMQNTTSTKSVPAKKVDALSISNKTETFGVHIDPNLVQNYKTWLSNNKNGIVAYRIHKARFNTKQNVEEGIIGNPFDWRKYSTDKCLQMFTDWLITGNNFGESLANDEYRSAIINKLLSIDKPNILYYKELNKPSHATILGYLIEHKELLQSATQSAKIKKVAKNYQEYIDVIQKYFDIGYTTGRIGKDAAGQVIQKLHIHVDEDSDLFDIMKDNNLSERDLLNALYALSYFYEQNQNMLGSTKITNQQLKDLTSKLQKALNDTENYIFADCIDNLYSMKYTVSNKYLNMLNFLINNQRYLPIYDFINDWQNQDIFDIKHAPSEIDLSNVININSTFDNINQLELFSDEDMKEAKEMKEYCKGGN